MKLCLYMQVTAYCMKKKYNYWNKLTRFFFTSKYTFGKNISQIIKRLCYRDRNNSPDYPLKLHGFGRPHWFGEIWPTASHPPSRSAQWTHPLSQSSTRLSLAFWRRKAQPPLFSYHQQAKKCTQNQLL